MIEIELSSQRGYAYGENSKEELENNQFFRSKITKIEKIQDVLIYTFDFWEFENQKCNLDILDISDIKCKHGHSIAQKSTHRLPQEGWQELIDCWSCHNHEFNSMLDLKIAPRPGGILLSNFYLIAHPQLLPTCCNSNTKIFYNDIISSLSNSFFIYKFFEEYFAMKSTIVMSIENKKYEIKLFYWCNMIKEKKSPAFKVGFRESTKQSDSDSFIGDFFKKAILNQLIENSIGIKLLDYTLSFIGMN